MDQNGAKSLRQYGSGGRHPDSRFSPEEFARILEWTSLGAAHSRQSLSCFKQHQCKLRDNPSNRRRLAEFSRWSQSAFFDEPTKIALGMSKAISSHNQSELSGLLGDAKDHFSADEIVRISSAALSVNEWIDNNRPSLVRILVVEDNPDDQALLLRQLAKARLNDHVMFISDGFHALDLLEHIHILDKTGLVAIFLDLHLPGIGGVELLRCLRQRAPEQDFPVIVMTSTNDPKDIEECRKLNVSGFVPKPITYENFSHAIAGAFHTS